MVRMGMVIRSEQAQGPIKQGPLWMYQATSYLLIRQRLIGLLTEEDDTWKK